MILPASIAHARMINHPPEAEAAIADAIEKSCVSFAGVVRGETVAIWGVQSDSLLSRSGYLWLTTTDDLAPYQFIFLKESRRFIERVSEDFDFLYGLVEDRDEVAKRFIRWLGFTIYPPIVYRTVPVSQFAKRWR